MPNKSTPKKIVIHRSAVSGKFVTPKFAKMHPNTTVKETVKKGS